MATINQITVNSTTYDLAVSAANVSGTVANATTATKLGTATKGSATQPIYLNAGTPTACTYSLAKSVPADAKFTDTTYSTFVKSGSSAAAGLVPKPSTTAGTTKYLREDGTWQVPPDTNTTYTLSSITGTLDVAKGGTGATTAADARTNLSVYSKDEIETKTKMKNRKFLILGDSYAAGYGNGEDGYIENTWATLLRDHIDGHNGCTATVIAKSGAGFSTALKSLEVDFCTLIENLPDKASYTDIVIGSGFNDSGIFNGSVNKDNVQEGIGNFINDLKTNFTGLNNLYLFCTSSCSFYTGGRLPEVYNSRYAHIYAYQTPFLIHYFNKTHLALANTMSLQSDTIHPTESGNLGLFANIMAGIHGSDVEFSDSNLEYNLVADNSDTFGGGNFTGPSGVICQKHSNGMVTVSGQIDYTGMVYPSSSNEIKPGHLYSAGIFAKGFLRAPEAGGDSMKHCRTLGFLTYTVTLPDDKGNWVTGEYMVPVLVAIVKNDNSSNRIIITPYMMNNIGTPAVTGKCTLLIPPMTVPVLF